MNNSFIYLVMFLAFFITVTKLYYAQTLNLAWRTARETESIRSSAAGLRYTSDNIRAMCPVTGYRCADPHHCDCHQICGEQFELFRAGSLDQQVVMTNHEFETGGAYCVPKSNLCNLRVARPIYTTEGWSCVARHPQIWTRTGKKVACTSDHAANNDLNYLVDAKRNRPVEYEEGTSDIDVHETLADGSPRYTCRCGSLDRMNNKMISLPDVYQFACLTDHCKQNVFQAGFPGWDGKRCDCGHLKNSDANDPTSPCVVTQTVVKNNSLTVGVPCTNKRSYTTANVFHCPDHYVTGTADSVSVERIPVLTDEPDPVKALFHFVALR